jgi:hypothetical protein
MVSTTLVQSEVIYVLFLVCINRSCFPRYEVERRWRIICFIQSSPFSTICIHCFVLGLLQVWVWSWMLGYVGFQFLTSRSWAPQLPGSRLNAQTLTNYCPASTEVNWLRGASVGRGCYLPLTWTSSGFRFLHNHNSAQSPKLADTSTHFGSWLTSTHCSGKIHISECLFHH